MSVEYFDFYGVAAGSRLGGSPPKSVKLIADAFQNPRVCDSYEQAAEIRDGLNREYGDGTFEVFGLTIDLHHVAVEAESTPGPSPANIKTKLPQPADPESPPR